MSRSFEVIPRVKKSFKCLFSDNKNFKKIQSISGLHGLKPDCPRTNTKSRTKPDRQNRNLGPDQIPLAVPDYKGVIYNS